MDTVGFCAFLALSSVLAANAASDWPLMDTIFLRFYNRTTNSNIDMNLNNVRDMVPLLDTSQKTVIYVHGYTENVETDSVKVVTKALLNSTSDNVISLDYGKISFLLYPTVVGYVPRIGAALAAALNEMVKAGLDEATVHLIGHSLGAQICGYTGRSTTFKVPRITGLDPAGPLFITGYLSKADASFVFIIHTDMGGYGIGLSTGHVDCKLNLGHRIQPGCIPDNVKTLIQSDFCSHKRSWSFFAESVSNPNAFPSVKCDSDFAFITGACDRSSIIPMGYYTPDTASGVYYCQTNSESPYNLGISGTTYNIFRS